MTTRQVSIPLIRATENLRCLVIDHAAKTAHIGTLTPWFKGGLDFFSGITFHGPVHQSPYPCNPIDATTFQTVDPDRIPKWPLGHELEITPCA